jgi:DNA-directed RNA polymerase sigma subunit (sigma70/sigma32)
MHIPTNYTLDSKITKNQINSFDFSIYRRNFTKERINRLIDILKMRLDGKSLQKIAEKHSVTKERIRQLEAFGVNSIKDNQI